MTVPAFGFLKAACCGDIRACFRHQHSATEKQSQKIHTESDVRGFMHDIQLFSPLSKIRARRQWSNPEGPMSFSYSPETHLLWNSGRESSWHIAPLGEILPTLSLFSKCWCVAKLWTISKQINTTYITLFYYMFPDGDTVKFNVTIPHLGCNIWTHYDLESGSFTAQVIISETVCISAPVTFHRKQDNV